MSYLFQYCNTLSWYLLVAPLLDGQQNITEFLCDIIKLYADYQLEEGIRKDLTLPVVLWFFHRCLHQNPWLRERADWASVLRRECRSDDLDQLTKFREFLEATQLKKESPVRQTRNILHNYYQSFTLISRGLVPVLKKKARFVRVHTCNVIRFFGGFQKSYRWKKNFAFGMTSKSWRMTIDPGWLWKTYILEKHLAQPGQMLEIAYCTWVSFRIKRLADSRRGVKFSPRKAPTPIVRSMFLNIVKPSFVYPARELLTSPRSCLNRARGYTRRISCRPNSLINELENLNPARWA